MRLPVCCCLLFLLAGVRGQGGFDGFDLSDALPDTATIAPKPPAKPQPNQDDVATQSPADIPKKPTTKPQPSGGDEIPKKPTTKPQAGEDDDFRLEDGFGGHDPPRNPTVKPQPGREGGGGGGGVFDDSDLGVVDSNHPSGHDDHPGGHDNKPSGRALQPSAGGEEPGQEGGQQSMVAGIVGAVAAAAVGAVSSFIAYQKKKLCFKGATDDPENVNMDSHKGDQSEPQVQSTLLAK